MKRTGELLKKAREEKGLSLHEIGLSLKISSKVLKAIEEGDESQLPAKTFLRGFVQSYANYLHIDTNTVLEIFYEEMGSTRPKPYIRPNENERPPSKEDLAAEEPMETPLKPQVKDVEKETSAVVTPIKRNISNSEQNGMRSLRDNKSTKTIIITVIAVVLVGLIIFTKKMIDKYSKEAEVPTNEVAQTIEGATPVIEEPSDSAPIDASPTPAPSAPLTPIATKTNEHPISQATPHPTPSAAPVSTPVHTPTPTPPPAVTPAPSPSPSPKPSAKPSPTPEASATPQVSPSPTVKPSPSPTVTPSPSPSPSPTAAASPTPKPTVEAGKPVELIVEALDTVEIEYAAPNGKTQKIKLSAEQVHTFKSRSGLKINFSNGGAVNLILNGKDMGIPGDLGQPIKLSY